VFDIRLRTMTESTWKILKLDWKTPEIFLMCTNLSILQLTWHRMAQRDYSPLTAYPTRITYALISWTLLLLFQILPLIYCSVLYF